jgi:hypothetical protein
MANIYHPPSLINAYLAAKINPNFGLTRTVVVDNPATPENEASITYTGTIRFFPTSPTDINTLTETFPDGDGVFAVYDRMLRMRRQPFPHIKCEQLLYYFYAFGEDSIENMVEITGRVEDLLNNGDESAEDLNKWARENTALWSDATKPIQFHNFKVYQLQETRDIIDFGTARTYAGNKIIVDFDWHKG